MRRSTTILFAAVLATFSVAAQQITENDTMGEYTMHGTYYSDKFVGRKTSSGEVFVQNKYTAAHKTLKFGTLLLVTNPDNGKQVIVRVNDRCPRSGVLDMTRRAAKKIGVGSRKVVVRVLPERYMQQWAGQDSAGAVQKTTPQEKPHTTEQQESSKLYNIYVGKFNSRQEAEKQAEQLPLYFLDRISCKKTATDGKTVLTVELFEPAAKAEKSLSEIQSIFPEARLQQAK